ncbi:transposase [Escherichia coli]|uniref:transposase n=1 Tax=Escherichia coli TaxID=562 RepID=UPI00386017FD
MTSISKKGNQWHFGMKAHIGVDAKSGLTHSLVTTAANEHDLNQLGNLLPNDTSVGEISLKTGDNALNGEETV